MKIGYARTSTLEQQAGFESQLKELEAAGCERVFKEQVSSIGARKELELAIEFVREGDIFIVTKLDRLARSISNLMSIIEALEKKKVGLRILNLGIDTQTPTGKLMLTVLGGIAQFEREIMLERQREGIAKAKRAGKYKGRTPIHAELQQQVVSLSANGISKRAIARELKIGEATVYRVLKRRKEI
jgi:DNA invertase Pin-like site-specific DNA recombinase